MIPEDSKDQDFKAPMLKRRNKEKEKQDALDAKLIRQQ